MSTRQMTLDEATARLQKARILTELAEVEAKGRLLEGFGEPSPWDQIWYDRFRDPDQLWLPLGSPQNRRQGQLGPFIRTEFELAQARELSRILADTNDFAKGIVGALTSFVIGPGFTYRATSKLEEKMALACQDVVDEFCDRNEWTTTCNSFTDEHDAYAGTLEEELFQRRVIDGEYFLRYFPQPDGTLDVRAVEPEYITQPPGTTLDEWSWGIQNPVEPIDIARTLAYGVKAPPGQHVELVDRTEITHVKGNVPRSVKRGIPDFYPSQQGIDGTRKLVRNLRETAGIQAAIAWIEQYDQAGAAAVQGSNLANRDQNRPYPTDPVTGRQTSFQRFEPGTIVKVGKGRQYQAAPLAGNTTQHIQIVQCCLRQAVVRWNMPEYMLGDASNANFASTLVAGSPFVRKVKKEQGFYKAAFLRAVWRAIWWACQTGRLPYPYEVVRRRVTVQVEAPEPAIADEGQRNTIFETQFQNGILSPQTWRQKAGYDDEQERTNLTKEPPTRVAGRVTDVDREGNPQQPQSEGDGLSRGTEGFYPKVGKDPLTQRLAELRGRYGPRLASEIVDAAGRLLEQESPPPADPEPEADLGELAEAVRGWLAELAELAGEKPPDVDLDRLRDELRQALAGDVSEGCVPNKSGGGHHDDKTGKPCSPSSGGVVGTVAKVAGAVPAKVGEKLAGAVAAGIKAPAQVAEVFAQKYAAAAGGKAEKVLKAAAGTLGAGVMAAVNKVKTAAVEKFKGWQEKFGTKGAVAVAAASVALLPVPLPGTAYVPLLAAHAFVAVKNLVSGKKEEPAANPTTQSTAGPAHPSPSPQAGGQQGGRTIETRHPLVKDALLKLAGGMNANKSLSREQKFGYAKAAADVLNRMPPAALERFHAGMTEAPKFYGDLKAVQQGIVEELKTRGATAEADKIQKWAVVGGCYLASPDRTGGTFHLDGGRQGAQAGDMLGHAGIYAHEFTHALDGPRHEVSKSPEWQEAFTKEIAGGQLTKYAAGKASEGFAEFGRLLYSGEFGADEVKAKFPRSYAVFQARKFVEGRPGLIGAALLLEEEQGPWLPELFGEYVELGEWGHADIPVEDGED